MNKTRNLITVALLTITLTGCALFSKTATPEQKAANVKSLSYAAASIGTSAALTQNPQWRPQFEVAYTNLDLLVTQKQITGTLLRNVVASLPIKELRSDTARIAVEGATTLFDATVGSNVNIETQPYVLAAAEGLRDGMKVALGK